MEQLKDKDVINNYLNGDEKSLEILIRKYLKPMYGFIYKNVGSNRDAEDITQEVFVKVWKNLNKFDKNKDFKPWIFQIAKNASIDFLRKKKSIPFSNFENEKGQNPLLDRLAGPALQLAEIIDNKNMFAMATESLSEKEKRIINLYYKNSMTFREIAELFQEPLNTIKSRYRRAIANIKKSVANFNP